MPAAVFVLTKKTYGDFQKGSKTEGWVVLHHMHGCPHCIMLRPTWDSVVRETGAACNVAEMAYDTDFIPAEMSDVRGFPTIRAYKNGKAIAEYNGDRGKESIMDFVMKYAKHGAGATGGAKAKAKPKPRVKPAPAAAAKRPRRRVGI